MRSASVSTRRCSLYEQLHVSAEETKTGFFKADNQEYCIVSCCITTHSSVFNERVWRESLYHLHIHPQLSSPMTVYCVSVVSVVS